jgi:histidine ammonia-lyase
MTAQGVINYIEAEDLGYQAEWIAALTHQALNGIVDAYDHRVHAVRNSSPLCRIKTSIIKKYTFSFLYKQYFLQFL